MSAIAGFAEAELDQLRRTQYNAHLAKIIEVHEDLRILRVEPAQGVPSFLPGQYCVLGLGNWEPRISGCQEEFLEPSQVGKLLKRAYSFSCPMLDEGGNLLPVDRCNFLEFYVVLVRDGAEHPPGLTPRMFALGEGARLFVGPKVTGHYTLRGVQPTDLVIFVATGTGEAPHNAMVADLLARQHTRPIASITCVRRRRDLGYLPAHRQLEQRYENYRYRALTTREPENLDSSLANFVGKCYLQEFFESGAFARETGMELDPAQTHVFLCGNPAMIGAPVPGGDGERRYSHSGGMVELLERRGFQVDGPHQPGNIHFEKYW